MSKKLIYINFTNVCIFKMETCIAIVIEGPRKGKLCQFTPLENGYCGRHHRNYQHAELLTKGKIPCRFFFRGCDNLLEKEGSCDTCKAKLCKKHTPCGHGGCTFKTSGDKYCKKHSRDVYRDEEKEKGIRYCDIARGCLTICKEGYTTCDKCREKSYIKEKASDKKRMEMHNAIEHIHSSTKQLCVRCGKDYEQFKTRYNKPSKICKDCNAYNNAQDAKRTKRGRNFKNESFKNLTRYYSDYIKSAAERSYTIQLEFNEFKTMVLSPCYYCHYVKMDETNGIDRINNSIGYEKTNCVPCCETCNMMKWTFKIQFFIELCKIISGVQAPSTEFYIKWDEYYISRPRCYSNYKKHAEVSRKLPFHITKEEWTGLIKQPCYLCGFQSKRGIGIDRIDSAKREYTIDNVKPCCYTCNVLKKDLTFKQIKDKAILISSVWLDTTTLGTIPT